MYSVCISWKDIQLMQLTIQACIAQPSNEASDKVQYDEQLTLHHCRRNACTWYLAAAASITSLTILARAVPLASLTISPGMTCAKKGAVCGLEASTCKLECHGCCNKNHHVQAGCQQVLKGFHTITKLCRGLIMLHRPLCGTQHLDRNTVDGSLAGFCMHVCRSH